MENLLPSLFSAVLLIVSTVIMVMTSLNATSVMAESMKNIEQRMDAIRSTSIMALVVEAKDPVVDIAVVNDGQSNLDNFDGWNVLLEAPNGQTFNLAYNDSSSWPGMNEWTISAMTMPNGDPEVFDPGILNPGETMNVAVNCTAIYAPGQVATVTFATPNGVTSQCMVTWPLGGAG